MHTFFPNSFSSSCSFRLRLCRTHLSIRFENGFSFGRIQESYFKLAETQWPEGFN